MHNTLSTDKSVQNQGQPLTTTDEPHSNIYLGSTPNVFYYVDAPAGSGKTEWAINFSEKRNQLGENVLIVVPTIKLVDDYVDRSDGRIIGIHSSQAPYANDTSVASKVMTQFTAQATLGAKPMTLVITEAALLQINYFHSAKSWCLIMDEASDPLKIHDLNCKDSKKYIKEWFDFYASKTAEYDTNIYRVPLLTDECPKFTDHEDGVFKELYKLHRAIKSDKFEVLVDMARFNPKKAKQQSGMEASDTDVVEKTNPILTYSVFTRPDLYNAFGPRIFMSANFTDTFLFHLYRNNGVKWTQLKVNLTDKKIDSKRVVIKYWLEKEGWSKTVSESDFKETKRSHLDSYLDWFNTQEMGNDYIYVTNNKSTHTVKLRGERVDAVCHGLNEWRHATKFMTAASYLVGGGHAPIYKQYGCCIGDARGLRNTQMLYQQLMRTDLRNYNSSQPITIYVPTIKEACDLLLYLPEATIQDCQKTYEGEQTGVTGKLNAAWSLAGSAPTVSTHIASNVVAYGANIRSDVVNFNYDVDDFDAANFATPSSQTEDVFSHEGIVLNYTPLSYIYDHPPKLSTNQPKPKRGAPVRSGDLFLNHICELNADISLVGLSQDEIDLAKRLNLRVFATGQFIEGSSFKASECIGNNAYLAFDFDGTDLTDEQFKSIFWGAKRLIYTTPSHGIKSGGRRLRVVVACNRTMSLIEHAKVMKHYELTITSMSPFHGLDVGKLKPYSKFFAPHAESVDLTKKNRNRQKPLDIDALFKEIEIDELKVIAPTSSDVVYSYPKNHPSKMTYGTSIEGKCNQILATMCNGNRSNPTVQIGGLCRHMNNDFKRKMYQDCQQRGADKSALNSFKKFSGMH